MALGDEMTGPPASHVVALIHGIRTQAYWQGAVKKALEKSDPTLVVVGLKYDYFDLFRFWCPFLTRGRPIQRIEDEFANVHERYPGTKLSVIAHSYGTYIVGRILLRSTVLHLHRLILCGAVLSRDYPWAQVYDAIDKVPHNIVNDYSPRDILPALAQAVTWGYGGAGTHGFGTALVDDRPHAGGHGDYFKPGFAEKFSAPLLVHGQYVKSGRESTRTPASVLVSILGILPIKYLILLALAGLLFLIAIPLKAQISAFTGDDKAQWRWVRYDEKLPPELRPVSWAITNNEADVDAIDRIRKQVTSAATGRRFR